MPMLMTKTAKNWPNGLINKAETKFPKMLELCDMPILMPKYLTSLLSILDRKLM